MADINITGSGSNSTANNYTTHKDQTKVSFHSADHEIKVCFTNSSFFNPATSYVEVPKGGQPTTLNIATGATSTNFTTNAKGADCPGANPKAGGPYTITIGSTPGPHPPGHGQHKK